MLTNFLFTMNVYHCLISVARLASSLLTHLGYCSEIKVLDVDTGHLLPVWEMNNTPIKDDSV